MPICGAEYKLLKCRTDYCLLARSTYEEGNTVYFLSEPDGWGSSREM